HGSSRSRHVGAGVWAEPTSARSTGAFAEPGTGGRSSVSRASSPTVLACIAAESRSSYSVRSKRPSERARASRSAAASRSESEARIRSAGRWSSLMSALDSCLPINLEEVGRGGPTGAREQRAATGRRLPARSRSEEHTSELQSREKLVCRLLLEKKKQTPPPA